MNKAFTATLLVFSMLCLMGCSGKKEEKLTVSYDSLKPAALEPMELNIYTYGGAVTSTGKDIIEAMLAQLQPATASTINVTPHFIWLPIERYEAEIRKLVVSEEKVDAFTCYSPGWFVDQDLCMDLSDMFKQYAPAYYQVLSASSIGEEYLSDCSVNGKLYAIPYNTLKSPRFCIVTRAELADKYAPDGLETLEDYGEFLKRIKENEADTYPGFVQSSYFLRSYMVGNGYYSDLDDFLYFRWDENGKNPYTAEQTPEFLSAFELLKDWKAKEYIVPNNAKKKYFDMGDGSLASYHVPMQESDQLFAITPGMQVQLKMLPLYMKSKHLLNTSAWGTAIAKTCKNPDRVLMFIEWIHSSQKNYDLFTYGVEGENYILQGENITYPRGEVQPLDTWKYYGGGFFQDFRYDRVFPSVYPGFKQAYQNSVLENIKTSGELREQRRETLNGLAQEYDQIRGYVTTYIQNMQYFFQSIDAGAFRISIEELKENQKEARVDKVLELYRKYIPHD